MECAVLEIRKMKRSQVSCFLLHALFLGILLVPSLGLSEDGTLLLSFKYSVSNDPLSVLENWNYDDATPCSWTGVSCVQNRVVGLALPGSRILGTIPEDLGFVEKLRIIDLSGNFLNGTLPLSLLNALELKVLNVSDNGLSGNVPALLASMQSLSVISLRRNLFSGELPGGFRYAEVLDFSGNSLNGSLPIDFGGERLTYLNLSSNKLSGLFPAEFAGKIPANATIDLSFNNLTGEIPNSVALSNQKTESFRGNLDLCGKPLNKACTIPSTFSIPPNITTTNSSTAAIAAIPQTIGSNPSTNPPNAASNQEQHSLKPGTIAGIAVGDLAGLGVIAMVCLYVYQLKTKKAEETETIKAISQLDKEQKNNSKQMDSVVMEITTTTARTLPSWSCLSLKNVEDSTSESAVSDSEDEKNNKSIPNQADDQTASEQKKNKYKDAKSLVMVDGETELELESLLRASAYILGSSTSSSIVYKAVLENGTAFAVRRIGDGVERLKEFENHAKAIAKLRHPNLVLLRGFYWGEDEKLVIYDYISNGSLANADYRRMGSSSPYHMPFQVRLKIAKGVARGLAYIHEKKNVHGNIKPSNILLTSEMEPVIGDFGLQWLMYGKTNHHNQTDPHSSSRHFGSKRGGGATAPPATSSYRDGSPCVAPVGFLGCTSPYHAPESFKSQKPNPKWDVYSFGVLLLELLTGKVFSDRELGEWSAGQLTEDRERVLGMADVGIRGYEDAVLACFKLGFKCASLIPGKRPSMKDARQVLDKIPCASPY